MNYKIADKNDIEILMDIRLEMLRIVNDLDDNYVFSDEMVKCSREYFEDGEQTTVLALDGDITVGCATMSYIYLMPTFSHPTGKRAHLMNVYTSRQYRRRGVAEHMIQMLIDDARKKGATEISLDSTEMGRPLYEKIGFASSKECMVMELI